MSILDTFDPLRDGWSFENFSTPELSWDLYRRTYLAINPSKSIASPLDLAFYEIFKGCAAQGNCGGMSMLGLALFRFGGYMGFGSPATFYSGGSDVHPVKGPARTDLYEALNIMQARQFSASGIRNFVDVVKAGQLNDALAAFNRIKNGLASGDYHMLSLANSMFGDAAHTVIPYRAEDNGATKTLWVWDPNRPADDYPLHYSLGANRLDITTSTSWSYDQNGAGYTGGRHYQGSNAGWCFAIPTSLIRHKARQPISVGFALTNFNYLFVTHTGSVAQIEDDEGRRLFADSDASDVTFEAGDDRRLGGVFPWPRSGGAGDDLSGTLFVLERPVGSAPLTVTVRGAGYRLLHAGVDQVTEVAPAGGVSTGAAVPRRAAAARRSAVHDRIRLETTGGAHGVQVQTSAARRTFTVHHVRAHGDGRWDGVTVRDVPVTDDALRVHVPREGEAVDVRTGRARRDVGIEFERFRSKRLTISVLRPQTTSADVVLRATPGSFSARDKAEVERR